MKQFTLLSSIRFVRAQVLAALSLDREGLARHLRPAIVENGRSLRFAATELRADKCCAGGAPRTPESTGQPRITPDSVRIQKNRGGKLQPLVGGRRHA